MELDVTDIKIVEEKSVLSSEEISADNVTISTDFKKDFFEQRFKNFNDAKILRTIKQICHAIGKYSDLQVVVDYLLEVFRSSSMYRKEAALLLNEILIGRTDLESGLEQTLVVSGNLHPNCYESLCKDLPNSFVTYSDQSYF